MNFTLQDFLHQSIPITQDMGLMVDNVSGNTLKVRAPLSNNINDKGSVFGGSSSALMIIAAWSLIKIKCDENNIDADIVIHKNETIWQRALYADLIIEAQLKQEYNFKQIKKTIEDKRHQRIDCLIDLKDKDDTIFSTMMAKYVIIPK
ncbi:MAG: YiiD C-terminal domain-containing protein [Marinicellaceae bacterium]